MVYRAIGLMSGSSLDGLDIVFAELSESGGKWSYEILASACYSYEPELAERLRKSTELTALEYQLLHADYGHYLGRQVNRFIEEHELHYKVGLIASHGHTTFHLPGQRMTAQLGDGAAIAAETGLPVVSDLRALDVALGGQGAPIVPVGEKLLFPDYKMFLNIGGIANISFNLPHEYIAFDICAANRVLNMLALKKGRPYDEGGKMAATGKISQELLDQLDQLEYYRKPYPKSLANSFGTDTVFPLIESAGLPAEDALATYSLHIAGKIKDAVERMPGIPKGEKLLVTGGGAFNQFLVDAIRKALEPSGIAVDVPEAALVNYKEALVMALIGVLRWRQENNVYASVTGAARDSIGGAVWNGQDA